MLGCFVTACWGASDVGIRVVGIEIGRPVNTKYAHTKTAKPTRVPTTAKNIFMYTNKLRRIKSEYNNNTPLVYLAYSLR